jgi:Ohr subfamily peroxiredoxin
MYTAHATAQGGRMGQARSDDGLLDVKLAPPKEMGGPGGGTNPEQMFAAGYAACFLGAMQFVAREKKLDVTDASVTGHVSIGPRDDGPGFGLAVRHEVSIPKLAQGDAEALVEAAHQVCPYSNATRGNIAVDFEVTGGAA